ncbi:hypothetical protein SAMN02745163_03398 [Clostridium cavendishii DSM 21758]|uniref:Lipoprotein n=1 Tax=Clostridium cavendishii DSM 21758 TaxID=1121302 RepID=A0A1M6QGV3_9CLOT|nr:hypothetical protein [Clostridium cavendishii]SHK19395.1 hypothetical protein SAMN02745163_03398 [Clostridium cavendishii DSM 21758]
MKTNKIIATILSGILALSLVACGGEKKDTTSKDNTAQETSANKDEKKVGKIKKEKNSLFELGKKQTEQIKTIVEKYGVKTNYAANYKGDNGDVIFSKDENDSNMKDTKGYTITSYNTPKISDGAENKYMIEYNSIVENGKNDGNYQYQISLRSLGDGTFKLENAKMLKELIQVIDKDYDFGDFDKWVNGFLEKVKADTAVSDGRDHGAFHENIKAEINDEAGKKELFLMYTVTLN